jgi:hypothetical protein
MGRAKEVDAWFARYENPMKDVVPKVRDIALGADNRVDECIKWQAPTFIYKGNIASFFPKSRQHASLMFHQGASIPGRHPLLTGGGDVSRVVKIGSVAEAQKAREDLEGIIRAWCDSRDAAAPAKAMASRGARKPRKAARNASARSRSAESD